MWVVGGNWLSKLGPPPLGAWRGVEHSGASRLALWKASTWSQGQPVMAEAGSPHLGHVLQQTDVDGHQPREALVGKTQAFHEEQQLCGAARVLDHVVELLAAQDVDITLAEERVWREEGRRQVPAPTREGRGQRGGGQDGTATGPLDTGRKAQAENATRRATAWSMSHLNVVPNQTTSLASGFLVYKRS